MHMNSILYQYPLCFFPPPHVFAQTGRWIQLDDVHCDHLLPEDVGVEFTGKHHRMWRVGRGRTRGKARSIDLKPYIHTCEY